MRHPAVTFQMSVTAQVWAYSVSSKSFGSMELNDTDLNCHRAWKPEPYLFSGAAVSFDSSCLQGICPIYTICLLCCDYTCYFSLKPFHTAPSSALCVYVVSYIFLLFTPASLLDLQSKPVDIAANDCLGARQPCVKCCRKVRARHEGCQPRQNAESSLWVAACSTSKQGKKIDSLACVSPSLNLQ